MKLRRLNIERNLWSSRPGEPLYKGTIEFDGEAGSIALVLTEQHMDVLFDQMADSVIAVSRDAAERLTTKAMEHKQALLDAKP
jgi:hypothetical protein